jgi:hypothetical protein
VTSSPSPGSTAGDPPSLLDAWQSVLAAEHVAVYGYGVVAARLRAEGADPAEDAAADLEVHRGRRDRATAAVVRLGGDPVVAEAAYAPAETVDGEAAAARLAAELERACAVTYADLVAAADPGARRALAGWLVAAAAAETRWSGEVPPLPGLDGRIG